MQGRIEHWIVASWRELPIDYSAVVLQSTSMLPWDFICYWLLPTGAAKQLPALCTSLESHETYHSVTFIVLVDLHQRWKQTRNRVCFNLWCELTLALWCHSIVTELWVSWSSCSILSCLIYNMSVIFQWEISRCHLISIVKDKFCTGMHALYLNLCLTITLHLLHYVQYQQYCWMQINMLTRITKTFANYTFWPF